MTSLPRRLLTFVLLACLSACVTKVGLPYAGAPSINFGNPIVSVASVADKRDDEPTYVGTIRGGFGNPLKILETQQPVADLVGLAFATALAQRGLLAAPQTGRYDLDLTLVHLDGNQVILREAVADIALSLRDHANGTVVYSDEVSVENENGTPAYWFTGELGIGGSIPDLHRLIIRTMNEAINQALDKPGFLALMTTPPSSSDTPAPTAGHPTPGMPPAAAPLLSK